MHSKYAESVSGDGGSDPVRRELVDRWSSYLAVGGADSDVFEWLPAAFAGYRDEVVHKGLQSFNDNLKPSPSDHELEISGRAFAAWLRECERVDENPDSWNREYWSRYAKRLRETRPELASRFEQQLLGTQDPGAPRS